MKKRKRRPLLMVSMVFVCLTGVAQEVKKAPETRKSTMIMTQELKVARIDSAADYQKFRSDSELKISENQIKIVDLKTRKAKAIQEEVVRYDSEVLTLEYKNNLLKARIKDSTSTKTENWFTFKREFNHDIDELTNAIKDLK
jgi:hypothetical protein